MSETKKRCAIVGAAVSGLPSARWAIEYGYEPVIFERLNQIGGLWRYNPNQFENDLASVMKFTVIDTSKEMNAYSDFPPPDHFANYMHNTKMIEYLELYTKHWNLDKYIRYRNTVTSVIRADDYEESGSWTVYWVDENGHNKQEKFDCVLLAQGHHAKPKIISFQGQELFQGNIIHSHEYKDSKNFEDMVNVVVGVGNSGMDLSVELGIENICSDYATTRFKCCFWDVWLPQSLRSWLIINQLQKRFDHAKYGICPKHSFYGQHATISDDLPTRIITGAVVVKPDIREFTIKGIIWADGTQTDNIDNVVMCTGYHFDFNLVEEGKLIPVKDNQARLYKNVFPPTLAKWNSLAIIGLVQPSGSILPAAEFQARLFFAALTGETKLPSGPEMEQEVDQYQAWLAKTFVKSTRHTIEVDCVLYMDSIAELLDCKPQPMDYIFSDPRLAYALLFGPNVSYVYRLRGHKTWDGARDAILGVKKRTEICLTERKIDKENHILDSNLAWSLMMSGSIGIIILMVIIKIIFL
uniref:Flavin-containing monooxygenase n=1 Tax=Meloidogyne hapla TaxID=6305 RepID=A0A1I8BMZ5_MELHA